MIEVFGLEKCDTCRKARNWLQRFGVEHRFVDYREQRVAPATLSGWAEQLGGWDKLVNRSSTTWRTLPATRKAPGSAPEWLLLIREYPQLVRRPVVVEEDGAVAVGFTDALFKKRFGRG